tara:strand:- start:9455 stop:9943 length:489 start_codon:yes stop_codon:yes gene_type:complete
MSNEQFLSGVEYPHPFDELAIQLCSSASRYVCILSPTLDHSVFDNAQLKDVLSALARHSRQTEVRMLVSDVRPLVARGHQLLELARRMPSKVHIQSLAEHPDWGGETVITRDRNGVLYMPADSNRGGFFEPASRASCQKHLDQFEELWRHSRQNPELRTLSL